MFRSSAKRLWFGLAVATCLLGFALLLVFYINTPRTSDILPAVTATQVLPMIVTAVPTLSATKTPRPLFVFGTIGEIDSITIVDDYDWVFGHTFRHYNFHRLNDGFKGQVEFTYSYYGPPELKATRDISLPQKDAQNFFQQLVAVISQEPLVNPTPAPPSTDQYLTLSIELNGQNGSLKLVNENLSSDNLYTVDYGEHHYIVDSILPRTALDMLKPFLREDVVDSFYSKETPAP